jgi:hypothetical protein
MMIQGRSLDSGRLLDYKCLCIIVWKGYEYDLRVGLFGCRRGCGDVAEWVQTSGKLGSFELGDDVRETTHMYVCEATQISQRSATVYASLYTHKLQ